MKSAMFLPSIISGMGSNFHSGFRRSSSSADAPTEKSQHDAQATTMLKMLRLAHRYQLFKYDKTSAQGNRETGLRRETHLCGPS
jgi:hypothetical protein